MSPAEHDAVASEAIRRAASETRVTSCARDTARSNPPTNALFHSALQEEDLQDLKEEVQRLNGMLQTAVTSAWRRAFKESVTRLLIEKGIVDTDEAL